MRQVGRAVLTAGMRITHAVPTSPASRLTHGVKALLAPGTPCVQKR
jgi:hypothetical protein